ncbi:hypothetical protein HZB02_06305 [Candidatus Woesearchaeota archaeon]|nr:hypothetical protein [Candidatus Woesearchaeota archaeon]
MVSYKQIGKYVAKYTGMFAVAVVVSGVITHYGMKYNAAVKQERQKIIKQLVPYVEQYDGQRGVSCEDKMGLVKALAEEAKNGNQFLTPHNLTKLEGLEPLLREEDVSKGMYDSYMLSNDLLKEVVKQYQEK